MFDDIKLTKAGINFEGNLGIMNPPIYRAPAIDYYGSISDKRGPGAISL